MRVAEATRMAFRVTERAEDVISKSRAEVKARSKGREDIREGGGIGIKKDGEKKLVVEDDNVKEEVRGDKGLSAAVAVAAEPA